MAEFERRESAVPDPQDDPDAAHWFAGDAFRGVLTPVLAGLLIDLADLLTFGPLGPWLGLLLGGLIGWQLAPRLGMHARPWVPALLAGVYCMTPGTALLPLATLVVSAMGLGQPSASRAPPAEPRSGAAAQPAPPTIEPEYRASWDDERTGVDRPDDSAGV